MSFDRRLKLQRATTDDRATCAVEDSDVQVARFRIVMPRGPRAPVIAHIPHASTVVPTRVRLQSIVLNEFVNTLSRLVFDPERFLDDEDEPMAAVGQGAFYTHPTDGVRGWIPATKPPERLVQPRDSMVWTLARITVASIRERGNTTSTSSS
jgi:hypothetical protein